LLDEVDLPEKPSKLKPYTPPVQPADKRVKRIPIPYAVRDINTLAPKLIEKLKKEGKSDREIGLEVRKLVREVEEGNKEAQLRKRTQISTSPEAQQAIQDILENKANFINEIRDMARAGDEDGAEKTLKTFIIKVVSDKRQKYTYKNLKDKNFDDLAVIISDYVDKKIDNYQKSQDIRDIDWIADLKKASVYQGNNAFPTSQTTYGVGLPKKIINHLREDDAENKALSKAFKKHMKIEKQVNGDSSDEEKGGALKFKHKKIKVGKGIEVQAQPAYKTFGKYVIHIGHLIDKNVANFKYPSLGSIPAIKPLTVSDDYKDFIMDTLENGKPNERIFSKLPEQEQKHFERVVLGAGLLDAFKLRRNKSDGENKDADRFNILRGEVMAGNNSDKVIKELRGLIIRFMNEGRIQQKEGTGMLVELSAI
jgi:heterodisulfide reductase subunit C